MSLHRVGPRPIALEVEFFDPPSDPNPEHRMFTERVFVWVVYLVIWCVVALFLIVAASLMMLVLA